MCRVANSKEKMLLHTAAEKLLLEVVKCFIKHGASPLQKGSLVYGMTPRESFKDCWGLDSSVAIKDCYRSNERIRMKILRMDKFLEIEEQKGGIPLPAADDDEEEEMEEDDSGGKYERFFSAQPLKSILRVYLRQLFIERGNNVVFALKKLNANGTIFPTPLVDFLEYKV
jgi:hypothetical protein